jgi:MarR family transcriptional regulator, organic hydroperoxide resistance regulator
LYAIILAINEAGVFMDRIEDCISFILGKAYQRVNQMSKERLAPHRVTPVQYAVLHVLWEQDGQSGAALGERLKLDSATMTGVLDRLTTSGLIERRAHPEDRRINRIFLTSQGRALRPVLEKEMDKVNHECWDSFSNADAKRLRAMLITLSELEDTKVYA